MPIENLKPGDMVASLRVQGLQVDVPYRAQYNWLSRDGLVAEQAKGRVASVRLGEHAGFVVINRRIKATPEHPFLVRRGDEWGFASAEFLRAGDWLIDEQMGEEMVESITRIEAPTRTVAIHIPGTNTLCAEGVWVHNDLPATGGSDVLSELSESSSVSSESLSDSTSGSVSASSSGSSSSSGSGSKSSGSSSFSSSSSTSGSPSSSSSGSGSASSSQSSSGSGSIFTP